MHTPGAQGAPLEAPTQSCGSSGCERHRLSLERENERLRARLASLRDELRSLRSFVDKYQQMCIETAACEVVHGPLFVQQQGFFSCVPRRAFFRPSSG